MQSHGWKKVEPEKTKKEINVDVVSSSGLSVKQLSIFALAISVAQGDQVAIKANIEKALQENIIISELKEVISHLFSYIGAPKILNGMTTLKTVIEERASKGIHDNEG